MTDPNLCYVATCVAGCQPPPVERFDTLEDAEAFKRERVAREIEADPDPGLTGRQLDAWNATTVRAARIASIANAVTWSRDGGGFTARIDGAPWEVRLTGNDRWLILGAGRARGERPGAASAIGAAQIMAHRDAEGDQ